MKWEFLFALVAMVLSIGAAVMQTVKFFTEKRIEHTKMALEEHGADAVRDQIIVASAKEAAFILQDTLKSTKESLESTKADNEKLHRDIASMQAQIIERDEVIRKQGILIYEQGRRITELETLLKGPS